MLNHWHTEVERFWQVVPLEMVDRYEQPITASEKDDALPVAG